MAVNLKTNNQTPKRNILLVSFVAGLLLIVTLLVAFGFYVIEKNQSTISPLKSAIHRLQLELEEAQQWIHNLSDSLTESNIEYVWFQLDLSLADFHQLLEGDRDDPKKGIPTELKNSLVSNLKDLDSEIEAYKTTVTRIFNLKVRLNKTPPDDLNYDQIHDVIQRRLEEMEGDVDGFLQKNLLFFRKLMFGGVIACLLLAGLIAYTFGQFLKQKTADYTALTAAHENLTHELAERKRAEASLRQSEMLFRTVFETSPDAIVITRLGDSTIIDTNQGFTVLSGFDREDIVGRSVYDVDLWQEPNQRTLYLEHVFEKGFAENWEAVFRTKQGILITGLLAARKIDIHGEPHILTVMRDISDRKLYEKKLNAANRFLKIGNRHRRMRPLLNDFVEEIKKVSGCSATAVRIVDEDGRIPHVGSNGFAGDFCSQNEPLSIHSEQGMCIRVIKNLRRPHESLFTNYGSYFVNNTSALLASASDDQKRLMRNTCHQFGYETIALIPIRTEDRTIGLIHVADREPDRLDEYKVEILESAALQLGTAIKRVQAEQKLEDSHEELEKQVEKRTKMLKNAKDELALEVEQRKLYENDLLGLQQRLRELSTRLIQTEERERRRIASEIHDRIGQTLAVTKMQLGAFMADFDYQDLKKRIESIREMISQTIGDVRHLTFQLSPPIIYELGLKAALEWLADNLRKQNGLMVEIIAADGGYREIPIDTSLFLYRTCNELLINVIKHAEATHAQLTIGINDNLITLKITDDGAGFDPMLLRKGFDPVERGFGLFSIQEQLQHLGGTMEIDSSPNQGSTVKIRLPQSNISRLEEGIHREI